MESDSSNRQQRPKFPAEDPGWLELVEPLAQLLERYEHISGRLAKLTDALRSALESGPPPAPEASMTREPRAVSPAPGSFDLLLAFQDQLSSLETVASVTMTGTTPGRTGFLVQLKSQAEGTPTIVCTECNRTLSTGTGSRVSHGLCSECLPAFLGRTKSS